MKSFSAMRWSNLALLVVLAAPSTTWAQRSNDDADSYSESRNARGEAEPPRLMRGGIMQQLRSVTESVMGTGHDDKTSSKSDSRPGVPTPPPLGSKRTTAEPRSRSYAPDDFQSNDPAATLPDRSSPGSRAWAGQFLIPNYRLREQVGTRNYRTPTEARRNAVPDDVPQVPANARPESRAAITGAKVAGIPDSKSPAPRRVYLGQGSKSNGTSSNLQLDEESMEQDGSDVGTASVPIATQETNEEASSFRMSDDEPQPSEPAEVLVSHVPDVPYVPRKPLPKRPGKIVSVPMNGPMNGPNSSASKVPSASAPSLSSPSVSSPSVSAPSLSAPSLSAPSLSAPSVSAPSVSAPANVPSMPAPTLPSTNMMPAPSQAKPSLPSAVPQLPSSNGSTPPSLELSSKIQDDATKVSIPSVPSKPLPGSSTNRVPAQTVSTPSSQGLPAASNTKLNTKPAPSMPTQSMPAPPASLPMATLPSTTALPKMPSVPSLEHASKPPALPPMPGTSANLSSSPMPTLPSTPSSQPATTPFTPPALPSAPPAHTPPAYAPPAYTPPTAMPSSQSLRGDALAGNQPRLHMEIPHIAVQLLGPGDLTAGTPTSYELQVQNSDRLALSGLILRMETPSGVQMVATGPDAAAAEIEKSDDGTTLLTWTVSQINAGGTTRLPLQLTSSSPRNFAVAIEWTVLPQSGIDEIVVKQADLQVALEGPVEVEKHGSNTYRLRVSNPGSAPAKGVKVAVSTGAPNNNAVDVGDLNPGQTEVIELDLIFEKAGQIQIGAVASSGALSRSTNIQVNVRQPKVVAELALPENVLYGTPLMAQVVVGNSGDAPARNLQTALQLPPGAETNQLPAGVSRDGDRLLWNIEQIPPGQEVQVPIELLLATPGTHELTVACVSPDGSVTNAKSSVTIEAYSDLKLLVNDPVAPAPVGAPVTYELTITNRGSRDAKNVQIIAQFSNGIEPETASGWNHQVVPGQVRFATVPQIAAGQSMQLKVIAKASVAGVHRFRAEVRCEDNEARLVEEESTRYLESSGRIAAPPNTTIHR